MKTITTSFNVYDFEELNEKQKYIARSDFIESNLEIRTDNLYENWVDILGYMFPNSDLDVQFSLNSCQGDGVNVYGKMDVNDVFNFIKNDHALDDLTEKEFKRFKFYLCNCTDCVYLKYNIRYTYNTVNKKTLYDEMIKQLDLLRYRNIDTLLIKGISQRFYNAWSKMLDDWENTGYDYLWNCTDEDIIEDAKINNYGFLENGKTYSF